MTSLIWLLPFWRLPRERGLQRALRSGALDLVGRPTAIFKDFAVYLVVIISVTLAVTSYLPVALAVILPDETYYLEGMHQPPTNAGALPLQEYRRDVPPGWNPGDPAYPLNTYFEKLRLWYRVCSVEDELVGPLIAGRLMAEQRRLPCL